MRFDCAVESERDAGIEAAQAAIERGELVVLPTDTVYGIAADAFSHEAVQRLLETKGRTRQMPPPVLVGAPTTLESLAVDLPSWLRTMTSSLWPGPLTVVCHQQPSLMWDLGETHQTVAVRMPDDPVALALLKLTGPLAVSSANLTGESPAATIDAAEAMFGEAVAVYLDSGEARSGVPSTILDATARVPRVLRQGALELARLHEFNNTIEPAADETGGGAGPRAADETGGGAGPRAADDSGGGAGPRAAADDTEDDG